MLIGTREKAILVAMLAGFLWGTSFPAIKVGLQYMDAYTFVFLRFLIASFVMLGICFFKRKFSLRFSKKRLILVLGVTNGIAYLLQYVGMVYVSASASSLLINLSVVWVALLSPLVFREQLNVKKAVGVMVSLLGVILMTTNLNLASLPQGELLSDLIVITAGFLWAIFIVYNKPLASVGNVIEGEPGF